MQSKLKDDGEHASGCGDSWRSSALAQLYVVRELLAAFALFALGFAALALVVASLYMLQKSWELAVARLAAFRQPVIARVTHMASVGNMARVGHENQKAGLSRNETFTRSSALHG